MAPVNLFTFALITRIPLSPTLSTKSCEEPAAALLPGQTDEPRPGCRTQGRQAPWFVHSAASETLVRNRLSVTPIRSLGRASSTVMIGAVIVAQAYRCRS